MSARMLDRGRHRKLGGEVQAMCQESIDTDASRSSDANTRESMRYKPAKLFDAVTLHMAMMFLGQTLLIIALVKL